MRPLVISLTTIPTRLNHITPTLIDLCAQTAPVSEIRLHIPRNFKRFTTGPMDLPEFPAGITPVIVDHDYGPATKVLHAAKHFAGQDVEILFCDDDQPYAPHWAARFLQHRQDRPNDTIAEYGYHVQKYGINAQSIYTPRARIRSKNFGYRLRRAASLGMWKPDILMESGYVDILTGFRGAMIRPEFLPETAYDIPEILWTVDDVWLSGQLYINGHGIWCMAPQAHWKREYPAHYQTPLNKLVHMGHDRKAADLSAARYFQDNYGIWLDRNSLIS